MSDYVKILKLENYVEVCLYADDKKLLTLMETVQAACPDAYMNGYNWEAFFGYYLQKAAPDILTGMKTDPEAGMYVAYWPLSPENAARAGRFEEIIRSWVEHDEELCRIVREEGGAIEWD